MIRRLLIAALLSAPLAACQTAQQQPAAGDSAWYIGAIPDKPHNIPLVDRRKMEAAEPLIPGRQRPGRRGIETGAAVGKTRAAGQLHQHRHGARVPRLTERRKGAGRWRGRGDESNDRESAEKRSLRGPHCALPARTRPWTAIARSDRRIGVTGVGYTKRTAASSSASQAIPWPP